jgi:cytochrome c-type biogenesis protein
VIDVLGEGLRAVALRSPLAYPLVFAAGVATSAGPCVAPRYVAVAALANGARRPWRTVAAFVAGLVGAYVALGLAAGALGALWSTSSAVYAVLAAGLALGGVVTLLRDTHTHGSPADERARACDPGHAPGATAKAQHSANFGGTFLLGASSAFVVSPCCTPVVAGIAGLTTLGGRTSEGIALLVAFALGHALPLLAAGMLSARIAALLARLSATAAPAVVSATLMLALAAYYGVLA